MEYYFQKYKEGRADKYVTTRNGVKIGQFNIGLGDIAMFPELETISILYVYPKGNILTIDKRSIVRRSYVKSEKL